MTPGKPPSINGFKKSGAPAANVYLPAECCVNEPRSEKLSWAAGTCL
jgi:hypothetical protein